MAFQYVAVSTEGEQIRGRIEAATEEAAEELLWKLNYTIVSLKEIRESASFLSLKSRIKTRHLIVFSRQLATLIESGIPIIRALHLLLEQISNKRLREVLTEIVADVQQGRFFSEAIIKHEGVFPEIYGRLIEVGERVGNLEMVLRQLATYMEKEEALVRRVRKALAYPSFVLSMAVGVVFLMLTVAMPPLMDLFKSFDAELPLTTKIMIALTNFFSAYKLPIVGGMLTIVLAGVLFGRTERGRLFIDKTLLKVPLIGKVIVEGAVARLCRSMSTLLQAGLALPEIIAMIIRTQGNRIIAGALEEVRHELMQGQGLAEPLVQQKVFPQMLGQMVRVGEETGSLDSNLDTLALFYEEQVDRSVDALAGVAEQALTIFIGGVVGFVAMSVVTPMYSLMGSIE